jgi:hypothetical protein
MADQFDPNNIAQGAEQAATDRADSLIDDVASKVPGGDQFAQQAKDAAGQAIQGGAQQAEQAVEGQGQEHLDNLPGGLGESLGDMFGGGSDNPSGNQ